MRVLVVGRADIDIRETSPELRHHMAVHVSAAEGAHSHSTIDALPPALAGEVTRRSSVSLVVVLLFVKCQTSRIQGVVCKKGGVEKHRLVTRGMRS